MVVTTPPSISVESPRAPDIERLLEDGAADAHARYPSGPVVLPDAAQLDVPGTLVYVARDADGGGILGVGPGGVDHAGAVSEQMLAFLARGHRLGRRRRHLHLLDFSALARPVPGTDCEQQRSRGREPRPGARSATHRNLANHAFAPFVALRAQIRDPGFAPGNPHRRVRTHAIAQLGGQRLLFHTYQGESGGDARPMHPEWVTSIRDQCVDAGVKFLFKQWGNWRPVAPQQVNGYRSRTVTLADGQKILLANVGKKAAGRRLERRTWDEYPA